MQNCKMPRNRSQQRRCKLPARTCQIFACGVCARAIASFMAVSPKVVTPRQQVAFTKIAVDEPCPIVLASLRRRSPSSLSFCSIATTASRYSEKSGVQILESVLYWLSGVNGTARPITLPVGSMISLGSDD